MSAGAFEIVAYQTDDGTVYPMRVQPETLALSLDGTTNAAAAGPIPPGQPSANAGGSRRRNGVNARQVRIKFTGTPPTGYKPDSVISLPVPTQAAYLAYGRGLTGTYLGSTVVCVGKSAESIR